MFGHLRANLLLALLTLIIGAILYPLLILVIGQGFFSATANGSLVLVDGKPVGSKLIAQGFTKDYYFQPRPSAVSYNGGGSGGSNLGANNPKLRDRVARQLATVVKYNPTGPKKDDSVQKDIEKWFSSPFRSKDESNLAVKWAEANPILAGLWVKSDDNRPAVVEWLGRHPKILEEWKPASPETPKPDLSDESTIPFDDLAIPFFKSFSAEHLNKWPEPEEFDTAEKNDKGEVVKGKKFKAVSEGADIAATFFDMWLQAHPKADLQKIPADLVSTSSSGLDPHITLASANSQIESVVAARATAAKRSTAEVRGKVDEILRTSAFTPLSGLLGDPIVNVLEVNVALDKAFPVIPETKSP